MIIFFTFGSLESWRRGVNLLRVVISSKKRTSAFESFTSCWMSGSDCFGSITTGIDPQSVDPKRVSILSGVEEDKIATVCLGFTLFFNKDLEIFFLLVLHILSKSLDSISNLL